MIANLNLVSFFHCDCTWMSECIVVEKQHCFQDVFLKICFQLVQKCWILLASYNFSFFKKINNQDLSSQNIDAFSSLAFFRSGSLCSIYCLDYIFVFVVKWWIQDSSIIINLLLKSIGWIPLLNISILSTEVFFCKCGIHLPDSFYIPNLYLSRKKMSSASFISYTLIRRSVKTMSWILPII